MPINSYNLFQNFLPTFFFSVALGRKAELEHYEVIEDPINVTPLPTIVDDERSRTR